MGPLVSEESREMMEQRQAEPGRHGMGTLHGGAGWSEEGGMPELCFGPSARDAPSWKGSRFMGRVPVCQVHRATHLPPLFVDKDIHRMASACPEELKPSFLVHLNPKLPSLHSPVQNHSA